MTDKLCYVSAYLDIGREKWVHFQRSFNKYFEGFTPLVDMFKKNTDPKYELIVYIDQLYIDRVNEYVGESKNITVVPINEQFMRNNIYAWSKLDREKEIMDSSYYKNFVRHRLNCPETHQPRYTLVNHAKIDFVNFSKLLSNAEYFCWVDFGYCGDRERIPKNMLDINRLDKDRINFSLINPITAQDSDVIYTIVAAPEKVNGGFFFGNRQKLEEYGELYHKVHKWFADNNLADDDQHLVIQSTLRKPDLFKLHNLGGWFRDLVAFQIRSGV